MCIGDKKRVERAQLNSIDGIIEETHDQFYRDHKLLLVLFRALAVMPITRSSPGHYNVISLLKFVWELNLKLHIIIVGKVTFSWKSLANCVCSFLLHCNDGNCVYRWTRTDSYTSNNNEIR